MSTTSHPAEIVTGAGDKSLFALSHYADYIRRIEEVLNFGSAAPPEAFDNLLQRLSTIWLDPERQSVLLHIEHMAPIVRPASPALHAYSDVRQLPEDRQDLLFRSLAKLVQEAEHLPAQQRAHADRAIARLSRLVTPERALRLVEPWLHDRRAFRRKVVTRVLRQHGVPESLASWVIEQYRATLDRELLKLISRNPHVAALLEESDVLRALALPANDREIGLWFFRDNDTRYWWMRAIEAYLIGGHTPSDAIAFEHPMQFAWAVGRSAHRPSLPLLRRVLDRNQADPEFVWRGMLAMERMGEPADINYVRMLGAKLVATARAEEHRRAIA